MQGAPQEIHPTHVAPISAANALQQPSYTHVINSGIPCGPYQEVSSALFSAEDAPQHFLGNMGLWKGALGLRVSQLSSLPGMQLASPALLWGWPKGVPG